MAAEAEISSGLITGLRREDNTKLKQSGEEDWNGEIDVDLASIVAKKACQKRVSRYKYKWPSFSSRKLHPGGR